MTDPIVIGTRGSALALAQASLVAEAWGVAGPPTRMVIIETDGDRRAPDTAWGEGAFVAAIERALLEGDVDVAIHSAKDVPTDEDPRLRIGAYLPRADPRDALVVRTGAKERRLEDLPPGTWVGTDSPRRTGFVLARRPDLTVHPLSGNVDTRLRRLDAGETDALVLACAGLDRLGLGHRISERLETNVIPPAPGQGAIAIQIRSDDGRMAELTSMIDDRDTRTAVEAERSVLRATGGGCRAPIGALATIVGDDLDLFAAAADPGGRGTDAVRLRGPMADANELVERATAALVTRRDARHEARSRSERPRVLITRPAADATGLVDALRKAGLDPITVPTIAIETDGPGGDLDIAARRLHTYAWVVVTSSNGVRALLSSAERVFAALETPRYAAIGPATSGALEREGIEIAFQPSRSIGAALAAELPLERGDRILVVRGDLASDVTAAALRTRGALVEDVIAYRTRLAPEPSRSRLSIAAAAGPIDAVLFTSASTVEGLLELATGTSLDVIGIPAICIGPETARVARQRGFDVLAVAAKPDAIALAALAAESLMRGPAVLA